MPAVAPVARATTSVCGVRRPSVLAASLVASSVRLLPAAAGSVASGAPEVRADTVVSGGVSSHAIRVGAAATRTGAGAFTHAENGPSARAWTISETTRESAGLSVPGLRARDASGLTARALEFRRGQPQRFATPREYSPAPPRPLPSAAMTTISAMPSSVAVHSAAAQFALPKLHAKLS